MRYIDHNFLEFEVPNRTYPEMLLTIMRQFRFRCCYSEVVLQNYICDISIPSICISTCAIY